MLADDNNYFQQNPLPHHARDPIENIDKPIDNYY